MNPQAQHDTGRRLPSLFGSRDSDEPLFKHPYDKYATGILGEDIRSGRPAPTKPPPELIRSVDSSKLDVESFVKAVSRSKHPAPPPQRSFHVAESSEMNGRQRWRSHKHSKAPAPPSPAVYDPEPEIKSVDDRSRAFRSDLDERNAYICQTFLSENPFFGAYYPAVRPKSADGFSGKESRRTRSRSTDFDDSKTYKVVRSGDSVTNGNDRLSVSDAKDKKSDDIHHFHEHHHFFHDKAEEKTGLAFYDVYQCAKVRDQIVDPSLSYLRKPLREACIVYRVAGEKSAESEAGRDGSRESSKKSSRGSSASRKRSSDNDTYTVKCEDCQKLLREHPAARVVGHESKTSGRRSRDRKQSWISVNAFVAEPVDLRRMDTFIRGSSRVKKGEEPRISSKMTKTSSKIESGEKKNIIKGDIGANSKADNSESDQPNVKYDKCRESVAEKHSRAAGKSNPNEKGHADIAGKKVTKKTESSEMRKNCSGTRGGLEENNSETNVRRERSRKVRSSRATEKTRSSARKVSSSVERRRAILKDPGAAPDVPKETSKTRKSGNEKESKKTKSGTSEKEASRKEVTATKKSPSRKESHVLEEGQIKKKKKIGSATASAAKCETVMNERSARDETSIAFVDDAVVSNMLKMEDRSMQTSWAELEVEEEEPVRRSSTAPVDVSVKKWSHQKSSSLRSRRTVASQEPPLVKVESAPTRSDKRRMNGIQTEISDLKTQLDRLEAMHSRRVESASTPADPGSHETIECQNHPIVVCTSTTYIMTKCGTEFVEKCRGSEDDASRTRAPEAEENTPGRRKSFSRGNPPSGGCSPLGLSQEAVNERIAKALGRVRHMSRRKGSAVGDPQSSSHGDDHIFPYGKNQRREDRQIGSSRIRMRQSQSLRRKASLECNVQPPSKATTFSEYEDEIPISVISYEGERDAPPTPAKLKSEQSPGWVSKNLLGAKRTLSEYPMEFRRFATYPVNLSASSDTADDIWKRRSLSEGNLYPSCNNGSTGFVDPFRTRKHEEERVTGRRKQSFDGKNILERCRDWTSLIGRRRKGTEKSNAHLKPSRTIPVFFEEEEAFREDTDKRPSDVSLKSVYVESCRPSERNRIKLAAKWCEPGTTKKYVFGVSRKRHPREHFPATGNNMDQDDVRSESVRPPDRCVCCKCSPDHPCTSTGNDGNECRGGGLRKILKDMGIIGFSRNSFRGARPGSGADEGLKPAADLQGYRKPVQEKHYQEDTGADGVVSELPAGSHEKPMPPRGQMRVTDHRPGVADRFQNEGEKCDVEIKCERRYCTCDKCSNVHPVDKLYLSGAELRKCLGKSMEESSRKEKETGRPPDKIEKLPEVGEEDADKSCACEQKLRLIESRLKALEGSKSRSESSESWSERQSPSETSVTSPKGSSSQQEMNSSSSSSSSSSLENIRSETDNEIKRRVITCENLQFFMGGDPDARTPCRCMEDNYCRLRYVDDEKTMPETKVYYATDVQMSRPWSGVRGCSGYCSDFWAVPRVKGSSKKGWKTAMASFLRPFKFPRRKKEEEKEESNTPLFNQGDSSGSFLDDCSRSSKPPKKRSFHVMGGVSKPMRFDGDKKSESARSLRSSKGKSKKSRREASDL